MSEEDLIEFDDDDAISFILNYLPAEEKAIFTEDDVQYLLDVIYEFYDKKGLLHDDVVEEVEIDEEELSAFIMKCAKADQMPNFTPENIQLLLDAEYEYSKSIGLFKE
ncbi:MAG: hypothetical protein KA373_07055 [Paludibacteraceae bacterium]|nr:hypothetical protein [Paludibacteraceae bacterium]